MVEANILAATNQTMYNEKVKCRAFNIGNGDNRSINDIANMLGGETTNINPVIEPMETLADNKKAKEILGWIPKNKIEDWIKMYKESVGI